MQSAEELKAGIEAGDRLSLSKAITLMESRQPGQQKQRIGLIEWAMRRNNASFRLAITGVPGAGKSTLIDLLGLQWIQQGHKVAVLAVDPTSSISQGSVLGDKTRMVNLARESNAFIRPSPTRLQLGGITATTFETLLLCEAAGFDRIIIETVGVGQSETLASELTDCCILLLVSGTGDDLQGVKRGILETADIILVNKADGDNTLKAKSFARELKSLAKLWPPRATGKETQVLAGSNLEPEQLKALVTDIEAFKNAIQQTHHFEQNRTNQKKAWMKQTLQLSLENELFGNAEFQQQLTTLSGRILQDGFPVNDAAEVLKHELLRRLKTG